MMTARALPVEDWPACEECGQPEERDVSEIAADEGLPVATLRRALSLSHPDASAFEVVGLAHRIAAGED